MSLDIFVTRAVGVAVDIADRVTAMYAGRFVRVGWLTALIGAPASPLHAQRARCHRSWRGARPAAGGDPRRSPLTLAGAWDGGAIAFSNPLGLRCAWTDAIQPRDLFALLGYALLEFRRLARQLPHRSFQLRARQAGQINRRGHTQLDPNRPVSGQENSLHHRGFCPGCRYKALGL